MFRRIYEVAKLVALLCVIPITIYLCIFLHSLSKTTDQVAATAKALPQQVDVRLGKLQTDVLGKIDTVQDKLNGEITSLATLSSGQIASILNTSDTRLNQIESDAVKTLNTIATNLNTQLTTTNTNLNTQLTTANNSITQLTTAYAAVPAQVGQQYNTLFGSYFDCAKNKLCLQGQASDTMFAVRQSSRDTSTLMTGLNETFPKIATNISLISDTFATDIPKITTNINGIALNINKITTPHWYDRIIGYALNGAVIYRSLNPVTSLTVIGAQVVSSQK